VKTRTGGNMTILLSRGATLQIFSARVRDVVVFMGFPLSAE